jgi:hypothetical protein
MEEGKKNIPSWAKAIIKHEKKIGSTPSDLEKEVDEEFQRLREEEKRKGSGTASSIPRFFFKV